MDNDNDIINSLEKLQLLMDGGKEFSFWNSVPKNAANYIKNIRERHEEEIKKLKPNSCAEFLIKENEILKKRIISLREALDECEENKRKIAEIFMKNME